MTRVNVDSKVRSDPRFRIGADAAGMSVHEFRSRCLDVWFACYDARTGTAAVRWVDSAAVHDGFAVAMVGADLAEFVDAERTLVRVRGVEKRIGYLLKLDGRARNGGLKSGESRRNHPRTAVVQTKSNRRSSGKSNSLTLAPALTPTQDQTPIVPKGDVLLRRRSNPCTPEQAFDVSRVLTALGEYTGVQYTGAIAHTRLILARIAEGVSVLDLRKVAWYCAIKLEWRKDPKMARYLRPETLYGPETIARYLDAARSAYRSEFGTDTDVTEEG